MLTEKMEARFHCAVKNYLSKAHQGKVMGDLRQVFGTPNSGKLMDVQVYTAPELYPNQIFVDVSTYIAAMTAIEDLQRQVDAMATTQLSGIIAELVRWQGKAHPRVMPLLWALVDVNKDLCLGRSLDFAVHKAGKELAALQKKLGDKAVTVQAAPAADTDAEEDQVLQDQHAFEQSETLPSEQASPAKPARREFLALAELCGAELTGKPDGSEPVSVVFRPAAWQAFDRAVAAAFEKERAAEGDQALELLEAVLSTRASFLKPAHENGGRRFGLVCAPQMSDEELLNELSALAKQRKGE